MQEHPQTKEAPDVAQDWPFSVELLDLSTLFADKRYQRPPQELFVEKIVNAWDDELVGVLDVSRRKNAKYAILDGMQRYTGMQKVNKTTAWCAVYDHLSVGDEAMFFYRKNKDRRQVHPFYSFRARMVAGDEKAIDINRIVESEGYKLQISSMPPDHLTAIRACEEAYDFESPARTESLSATIHCIRRCWYEVKGGREGDMIRGLGRFFQPFYEEEIDWEWLEDRFANSNPRVIRNRAKENWGKSGGPEVARELVKVYNRGLKRGKLNANLLSKSRN